MTSSTSDRQSFLIPFITLSIFITIGLCVWGLRNILYFYLFTGIGTLDFISRMLVLYFPKLRQLFRLTLQFTIGSFLLLWLGLVIGVNFQFPEIIFDIWAGVVTGALIQFVVARIILPFFLGNAFCSRACWTGFFFEMTNSKKARPQNIRQRSAILAWAYLVTLVGLAVFTAFFWDPASNIAFRKWAIVAENLFITATGFTLTFVAGSRFYCRMLCPFLTLSGLISPASMFKITPVNDKDCTQCLSCDESCPMLINVNTYVNGKKRINDPTCILCERCISSCRYNVLKLTTKNHLPKI